MSDSFLTFQKFNDPGLANAFAEKLKEQHIEFVLEDESPNFDPSFANTSVEPTLHLKARPEDFSRARTALENYYQAQLSGVDPDYYLFSFTDAELLEIITKPDEWGPFDYVLAKKLLADRGKEVAPATVETLNRQRLQILAQPETTPSSWVYLGYISAILGGVLGLFLGYILAYFKKTLPNGEKVFMYTANERWHGRNILVLSAISFPLWMIWRLWAAAR